LSPSPPRAITEFRLQISPAPLIDFATRAPEGAPLRTTALFLQQEHMQRGRRGLALCAPAYGAGVTFVTAALAVTLALDGGNILIIDANLHRPQMQVMFPPPEHAGAGLLQVLRGEADLVSAIERYEQVPNLSLMYAGGEDENGAELFDGPGFEQIIRDCQRSYDLVLVDTPPANRFAESRRIAAVTGYAAFVARRDRTYSTDLATLARDLKINRVEVIGTILNEG